MIRPALRRRTEPAHLGSADPRSRVGRRPTGATLILLQLALCLAAVPARVDAACTSTETCLQAIDAEQAGLRTISARFVQTKHVSLMEQPLVSRGRFFFARPDRMRLEIETPQPAVIVINGRDISIPGVSAQERQAMGASPMAAMFTELGAMFAGSSTTLQGHFTVSAAADGDSVRLTLVPTEPSWQKLFRSIELHFAGPQLTISAMRLDDALGDRLDIEMQDVRRNETLPETLFTVARPEAP